jgi:hypothetical protein
MGEVLIDGLEADHLDLSGAFVLVEVELKVVVQKFLLPFISRHGINYNSPDCIYYKILY